MDPRVREDDGMGVMDPRIREDDGMGVMDPRLREDDGMVSFPLPPSFLRRQESIPAFAMRQAEALIARRCEAIASRPSKMRLSTSSY